MMSKRSEPLFNDISIKEISLIFSKIDDQIIDLHKCSSDDFLGLSSDFKRYYSNSKGISDKASEIFELLSEENNKNLFNELQTLYKDLNKIQTQSRLSLRNTSDSIKCIKTLLEQLFIPIKNLKQNLSTLKFLIANINLSEIELSSKVKANWENSLEISTSILNDYRESCAQSESQVLSIESNITNVLNELDSFCHSNTNDFENLLNNIHFAIIFFAEKHEEVKLQIPELTLKTKNNSQNISEIITNLQYQDIIRQKIEHIQKGHSKIQPELQELYEKDCSDNQKEIQLFQKVKDIAGLQAAILVSANKEYQVAIEKITNKFIEIGDDMVGITAICTRLNSSQDNITDLHLVEMLDRLCNSEQLLTNFIQRSNSFHEQIKTINNPLYKVIVELTNLVEISSKHTESIQSIISFITNNSEKDSTVDSNLSHLVEVFKDINQFENSIQNILIQLIKCEEEFDVKQQDLDNSVVSDNTVKKAVSSINSVLKQVEIKGESVRYLLGEISSQSINIVQEIKDSIKRIKYYDLFEKSINSIISDLNQLHSKLSGSDLSETQRIENLSTMKGLYTMETEHKIHDRIISQNEGELFTNNSPDEESEAQENTDEVELF